MRGLLTVLAGLSLLVCAWVARTNNRHNVFTHEGVELQPTDSHYYVRFAERQLKSFPKFEPFDPYVNFPTGARIIWPPLHAFAVAGFVRAARLPEAGAAWVGPYLSLLELLLVFLIAWRLKGGAFALMVSWLWALMPLSVVQGILGCADHHLHEPFEVFLLCLFCGLALEEERLDYAIAAGVVAGLSRLLTPGAFVPVPMIAAACGAAGLLRPKSGGGLNQVAAILGLSGILASLPWVWLFGVSSLAYEELSFFQPVLMLGLFLFAGGVARRGKRGVILCASGLAVLATLTPQLVRAAGALGRVDPLLKVVEESQPLFKHPDWISSQYGAVPVLLLPAIVGLLLMLRARKLEALPWLLTLAGLAFCAAFQSRFGRPMMGALFGAIALGVPRAISALQKGPGRVAWVLCGLLVLPLVTVLRPAPPREPQVQTVIRPTLQWMHEKLPRPDPAAPKWGVIAPADLGHLLMLWSELPAVATPFSQAPAHLEGNLRASKVLAAADDELAYEAAQATKGKYLVLYPQQNILGFPDVDVLSTWCHQLWRDGGAAEGEKPGSGHFRLIYSARERVDGRPYARVFEVVPGALLKGMAEPGSTVTAGVWARVDGPDLAYRVSAVAGADGVYAVRVAQPGKFFIHRDHSSVEVLVTEENLRLGSELHEPLPEQ